MLFLGVSNNRSFPTQSSILIGFSIVNHPFWDIVMVPFRQAPEPFGPRETWTLEMPKFPKNAPKLLPET